MQIKGSKKQLKVNQQARHRAVEACNDPRAAAEDLGGQDAGLCVHAAVAGSKAEGGDGGSCQGEEVMQMKTEAMEEVARMAAKEAVKEYEKQLQKNRRVKIFHNTKKLMENYNRICQSVEEGISDITDMDNSEELEGFTDEDIFINSILKGKLRSIVMIAHIDKCLSLLEAEEYRKNTPEKYFAFKYFYLDGMTYESIAEVYGYGERTARRWITELTDILGIYLFGSDAIMLD